MPARPAPIIDPYATLGLQAGATSAEVKRAYRRLAKAFHPDSAGEQAIPRFLAIQAAYEQIRTGRVTLGGVRGGGRSTSGGATASSGEPWRADPARARAARERARAGTRGSSGGTGTGSGPGAAPGARPPGSTASSGTGRRSTGTSGTTGTGGTTGRNGTSGGGSRKRATRKATLGSTSYDEARDPADATWSGASWYGPSTGEYWIVNPREYADPRKHGPHYQQRARRPLDDTGVDADVPDPQEAFVEPPLDEPATSTSGPAATFEPPAGATARGERRRSRAVPRWDASAADSGWSEGRYARTSAPALEERASARVRWLREPAGDPVRRLGQALVAWPPIGLAAAALIGNATGCSAFSAQCDGTEPMLPWLAQAVILGLLLLVPPVTRLLAWGTIAILVGVVPLTSLLLAVGAAGASEAGPALTVLLGVLWLVGVTWATALRVRRLGGAT